MVHKLVKRLISGALALTLVFSINGFAAVVTDSDGSAFITKAEFDSLKNGFQAQIDSYNQAIDSKIDGAIASYLAGIKQSTIVRLDDLYSKYKITGVTYDNGAVYWSSARAGGYTNNKSFLSWKSAVAYAIDNVKLTPGTYTAAQQYSFGKTITGFAALIDHTKNYDTNIYVEKNGLITRASNRKYVMNSSLIWNSVARNHAGDTGTSYGATGYFSWAMYCSSNTINRTDKPVWSNYVGAEGTPGGSIQFSYTSFSIDDDDLAETLCFPVYAGDDEATETTDTKYYVDKTENKTLTVTESRIDVYTESDSCTFTTPTGCTAMTKPASAATGTLRWPGASSFTGIFMEREPRNLKFKDFIDINDKNNMMKNGLCIVDNLPEEGPVRLRFQASAAGQLTLYSGAGATLDYANKKSSIIKDVVAGNNSFQWDVPEKGDYLAIKFIPTVGVGKLSNFIIEQIVTG